MRFLVVGGPGGPGECTSDADCSDNGLFCDGTESCNLATGQCVSSGDPCSTGETCNEGTDTCDAPTAQCNDGQDNDGDGAIDSADFACQQGGPNEDSFLAECQDGLDNEQGGLGPGGGNPDNWIDAADPGCWTDPTDPSTYNSQDNSEAYTGSTQCSNEQDDDGDGLIDGFDPPCICGTVPPLWNSETNCAL